MDSFAKRAEASSQIQSAVYKAEPQELRIVFKGSPDALYAYLGVKPDVWAAMQQAESLGRFVNQTLKGTYQFDKRVEPATLAQQATDFAELLATLAANQPEPKLAADQPAEKDGSEETAADDADEDEGSDLVEEVIEGATIVEALAGDGVGSADSATVDAGGGDFGGGGATGDFSQDTVTDQPSQD